MLRRGAVEVPLRIGEDRLARTYLKKTRWFVTFRAHAQLLSSQFSCLASILLFLWMNSFLSGWVCQWKPFWIPVGESFQKAHLDEWIHMGDNSSGEQGMANIHTLVQGAGYKDYTSKQKLPEEAPSAPRSAGQRDALTWEPIGPQGTATFWENGGTIASSKTQVQFHLPKQLSPLHERLELPFPSEEILSGYEDVVSSGTDQFTTWVKTHPDVTSVRHMVDVQKAVAEFREASERRHDTSSQEYHFDNVPNRSLDVEKKVLLRSKSQASGTSSHCRKQLTMLTRIF